MRKFKKGEIVKLKCNTCYDLSDINRAREVYGVVLCKDEGGEKEGEFYKVHFIWCDIERVRRENQFCEGYCTVVGVDWVIEVNDLMRVDEVSREVYEKLLRKEVREE